MNVDQIIYDLSLETKTWYCQFIVSIKFNKYPLCIDKNCCKKVTPHPVDGRVVCNNPTCKRKIFVSQCKTAVNAELLLTDQEDDTKKTTATSFDSTLVNVVGMNKEKSEIEDDLLSLKNFDITYNKK